MYDTVFFRLTKADANGVDFLEDLPRFLGDVGVHDYRGVTFVSGSLNGLKVKANACHVDVRGGSLCKFLLGGNYSTMGRKDTQRAIEKLSDSLHLPMDKATVTRMDVAQNLIMKHPVAVYLNRLGVLRNAKRLEAPSGLYYRLNKKDCLCLYDKNEEQKSKNGAISDLYTGRNVSRYERRFIQRIAAKFKAVEVTGAMLYDEAFYIQVLNAWKADYQAIQKINDIDTTLNFQMMKTVSQFHRAGVLSLIEKAGGQTQMLNRIKEAQQRGELTKKQALDFRKVVNEACQVKEDGLTAQNEAIKELDRKVADAVKFYR